MRIITGTLKGRRLTVPANTDVRPTSDRAKESIFSVIEVRKHITKSDVLDLFAGSGNLGFEAVSRGAGRIVFVEASKNAVDHIKKTAEQFRVDDRMHVICATAEHYLQGAATPFDVIFADPPYEYERLTELPDIILNNNWLKPHGWLILEHDKRHTFSDHPHCVFTKPYGRTIVTIFTNEPAPAAE